MSYYRILLLQVNIIHILVITNILNKLFVLPVSKTGKWDMSAHNLSVENHQSKKVFKLKWFLPSSNENVIYV